MQTSIILYDILSTLPHTVNIHYKGVKRHKYVKYRNDLKTQLISPLLCTSIGKPSILHPTFFSLNIENISWGVINSIKIKRETRAALI